MEHPGSPRSVKSGVGTKPPPTPSETREQKYIRERNEFIGCLVDYDKMSDDQLKNASTLFNNILSYSKEPAITMCNTKSGKYAKEHIGRIETLITNALTKQMYCIAFGLEFSNQIKAADKDLASVIYRYITLASIRSSITTRCITIEQEWKFQHRKESLGYDPEIERRLSVYVDLMARKKKEIDLKVAEYRSQANYWEDKALRLLDSWAKASKVMKPYIEAMKIPADQKEIWETEFWDMSEEEKHGFSDDLGVFISKKCEELMVKKRRQFYCSSAPEDIIKSFEKRDLHKEIADMIQYVDTVKESFRRQTPEQAISEQVVGAEGPAPGSIPVTVSL